MLYELEHGYQVKRFGPNIAGKEITFSQGQAIAGTDLDARFGKVDAAAIQSARYRGLDKRAKAAPDVKETLFHPPFLRISAAVRSIAVD